MTFKLGLAALLAILASALFFVFSSDATPSTPKAPEPVAKAPITTAPPVFSKPKRDIKKPDLIPASRYWDAFSGAESIDGTFLLLSRYFDHLEYLETAETLTDEQKKSLADIGSYTSLVKVNQNVLYYQKMYSTNLGAPNARERLALLDSYLEQNRKRLALLPPPKEAIPDDPTLGDIADINEDPRQKELVSVAPDLPQIKRHDRDALEDFQVALYRLLEKQEFEAIARQHIDYQKPLAKEDLEKLVPDTARRLKKEFGLGGLELLQVIGAVPKDWFYADEQTVVCYSLARKPFTHMRFSKSADGEWKFISLEKGLPDLRKAKKVKRSVPGA